MSDNNIEMPDLNNSEFINSNTQSNSNFNTSDFTFDFNTETINTEEDYIRAKLSIKANKESERLKRLDMKNEIQAHISMQEKNRTLFKLQKEHEKEFNKLKTIRKDKKDKSRLEYLHNNWKGMQIKKEDH